MRVVVFEAFEATFMQRAALEIVLLAPLAGLLGAQIVLRNLAFFTHSVGTAAFPGLVLAGPAGVAPSLMALGVGGIFAGSLEGLSRTRGIGRDAATGLLLVGALALGIVLASDVYESGAGVDRLLFGSLLAIGPDELRNGLLALALVALAAIFNRRTWLATGFDPDVASALGLASRKADFTLLAAIALASVIALEAVGALLVSAVLVIPAATARLFAKSVGMLEIGAAALALGEGLVGLWLAYKLDVPPGAAIATLAGSVFLGCLLLRSLPIGARA